jgi:exonuclease SbcC
MENEVVKIRSRMEGQQKERDQYALERQAIFGDRDPEKEETRLSADVASADRQLETARENWAGADRRLRQVASKIEELVRTMGIREIQLTKSEAAFLKRLNASGFSDEQDYRSAGLSEGVRMHLGEQSRRLADEKADLAARLGDKGRLLEVERRTHVTAERASSGGRRHPSETQGK